MLCWATAASKGQVVAGPSENPTFAACLDKVKATLEKAWAKADLTGPCAGTIDEIESIIDLNCIGPVIGQTPPPGCGNGITDASETCDDGNTVDGDSCPSNCVIKSCTVNTATSQNVSVRLTTPAGVTVGAITFLVDYPEGQVRLRVTTVDGSNFLDSPNDLTYALKDPILDINAPSGIGIPANGAGTALQIAFNGCQGQPLPTGSDYKCTVTDASDENGTALTLSTLICAVTIP